MGQGGTPGGGHPRHRPLTPPAPCVWQKGETGGPHETPRGELQNPPVGMVHPAHWAPRVVSVFNPQTIPVEQVGGVLRRRLADGPEMERHDWVEANRAQMCLRRLERRRNARACCARAGGPPRRRGRRRAVGRAPHGASRRRRRGPAAQGRRRGGSGPAEEAPGGGAPCGGGWFCGAFGSAPEAVEDAAALHWVWRSTTWRSPVE